MDKAKLKMVPLGSWIFIILIVIERCEASVWGWARINRITWLLVIHGTPNLSQFVQQESRKDFLVDGYSCSFSRRKYCTISWITNKRGRMFKNKLSCVCFYQIVLWICPAIMRLIWVRALSSSRWNWVADTCLFKKKVSLEY